MGRDYKQINEAIDSLIHNPRPIGASKVRGNGYRIRVGQWRVLYEVDDELKVVTVSHIRRRNERTYRNI